MPKLNLTSDDFYMSKVIEFLKQNVTEALADKSTTVFLLKKTENGFSTKKT